MQIEAVQCIWNPILVWHRPFHKSLSSDCSECSVSHRQSEAVFQKHSSQLNSPPVQPEVRGCSNHLKHFQVAQDDRVLLLQWRENRHNTCSWRRSQRCFAAKVPGKNLFMTTCFKLTNISGSSLERTSPKCWSLEEGERVTHRLTLPVEIPGSTV